MHCESIKQEKMDKLKEELEILKKPFLKEKWETLNWIAATERKLGLPVSVEVLPEKEEEQSKGMISFDKVEPRS